MANAADELNENRVTPKVVSVAADVVDEAEAGGTATDQITLSNGIVLKVRPVPPRILRHVNERHPQPKIPRVFIEDKGREEENPNDPDYLLALQDRVNEVYADMSDALMMAGTTVVSVPDGYSEPAANDWLEIPQLLGITVNETPRPARYLDWLRYHALSTESDIGLVVWTVISISGVSEIEVARAVKSFRRSA